MRTTVIEYIENLTLQEFNNILHYYEIDIPEEDICSIYSIIKNNIFALLDEEYHSILYHYIEKKTSSSTCQKIYKMISENPFYFKVSLKA